MGKNRQLMDSVEELIHGRLPWSRRLYRWLFPGRSCRRLVCLPAPDRARM